MFWDKLSLFQEFMFAIAVCASVAILVQFFSIFIEKETKNSDEALDPRSIRNKLISTGLGVWFWLGFIFSLCMNEFLACFVGFIITLAIAGILILIFKKDVLDLVRRIKLYKETQKQNDVKLLDAPKPEQLSIDDIKEEEVIELGSGEIKEDIEEEVVEEIIEDEPIKETKEIEVKEEAKEDKETSDKKED